MDDNKPATGPDVGFKLGDPEPGDNPIDAGPGAADPFDLGTDAVPDSELPTGSQESGESGEDPAGAAESDADASRDLAYELARELAAAAPEDWSRLDAVFALTATESASRVFYTDSEQIVEAMPGETALNLARAQRASIAGQGDGPWWRLILGLTGDGEITVDYDYGEEPFPDEQLLSPEAYRNDLEVYPREWVPVWLAAYIADDSRQERSASEAALQATLDAGAEIRPELTEYEFPPLPVMWVRWVTLSAAFVLSGSTRGPRMMPALAWFEGSSRSGSTLSLIPGGRAVLSGGLWEAPELDAAYNGDADMPELFLGAPFWVADQVLNPRAAQGLLSFCYWWDGAGWYRGESPSPADFASALPGIWTSDVVVDLIADQLSDDPDDDTRKAATGMLAAAEGRTIRRELLAELFGEDSGFDLDGAYYQFFLGGLTAPEIDGVTAVQAEELVRRYFSDAGLDTEAYPLDQLTTERLDAGWLVWARTAEDEAVVARTVFYVADDGLVERSSSAITPEEYVIGFTERLNARRRGPVPT